MVVPVQGAQARKGRACPPKPLLLPVPALLAVFFPPRQGDSPAQPRAFDSSVVTSEPADVAAFLTALARGDPEAADDIALPPYRAEWELRGLTPADRRALQAGTPPGIVFTFAGGVLDDAGFG